MNITREMIRRIIREQEEGKLPETPSEVEATEDAWSGGGNLELDVDHSKVSTDEPNVASPEVLELVVAEVRKRLIEKAETTKKYDDSKHLKGGQDKLPDGLQKGIIDKAEKMEEVDGADHDGALMDLDDYYELEDLLSVQLRDFLRGGYSKEDLIQALTNIVNDAL